MSQLNRLNNALKEKNVLVVLVGAVCLILGFVGGLRLGSGFVQTREAQLSKWMEMEAVQQQQNLLTELKQLEQNQLKNWVADMQRNAATFENLHVRVMDVERQIDKPKWHIAFAGIAIFFIGTLVSCFFIWYVTRRIVDKDEIIFQVMDSVLPPETQQKIGTETNKLQIESATVNQAKIEQA
jgi:hypothetical protein